MGELLTYLSMGSKRKKAKKVKANSRDRPEGWQYAKESGHALEIKKAAELKENKIVAAELSRIIFGTSLGLAIEVEAGGKSAKKVADVFGKKSPSKTDIFASWGGKNTASLSLKKSTGGQVFLTSVERFCDGFEIQFGRTVDPDVREVLNLFIGGSDLDLDSLMVGKKYLGPMHAGSGGLLEIHQNRLVGATIARYFPKKWLLLIQWFQENSSELCEFIFSRGYSLGKKDFSTHLWYFVEEEEKKYGIIDSIFKISDLSKACSSLSSEIAMGKKNGGSTVQFPFGFLQMHRPQGGNQMQFHHSFDKISSALC